MEKDAPYWIRHLGLESHAEGGAFREIYRSNLQIPLSSLPAGFHRPKSILTSIYFLLEKQQRSLFHQFKSDEIWHFYAGDPLHIYEIHPDGTLETHLLGKSPDNNESFQQVVRAGSWLAAQVAPGGTYSLAGCTVSPGFDFEDFVLAHRTDLLRRYPAHHELITAFTPSP